MIKLPNASANRLATTKDIIWLFWPLALTLTLIILVVLVVIATNHPVPAHSVFGSHSFTTQDL